jgi:sugar lactone lactonase YvrE
MLFFKPLIPLLGLALLFGGCSTAPTRPAGWAAPEPLVAPSSFHGVHGLAVDAQGRLLAGTVVGNDLWLVDRNSGAARVFIGAPEGQADDIAIGPKGELAWTSYLQGIVRYRQNDNAPIRVLAKDLPGINSLAFDMKSGRLYASQVFLGDAMWEIDVAGAKPPRLIAKDMGGFNGFEVGPDGLLYGPLWFKGSVARMDPATGAITVINSEFKTPAAANLDGKGNLWVIDTQTGELARVDLANGRKTVVKKLATALDNLAIAPDGTIYVSNMADNAVLAFNPASGEVRTLTQGKLAVPAGLKVEGDTLWVADIFSFREVDLKTGAVRDIHRMQASDMEYPFAVGVNARQVLLTSWFTGSVQVLDRAGWKTAAMLHGLKAPMDAQFLPDGSIVIAEIATGSITIASGAGFKERRVLVAGLAGPVQMVVAADGKQLYVTEAAGNLLRIDLASGAKTVLADKLLLPEGLALTPWGSVVVAEAAARRLTEIDPAGGTRRTVADNLPIGLEAGPGLPPPYVVTGVAAAADGTLYFSADRNNAIYRVRPQRP